MSKKRYTAICIIRDTHGETSLPGVRTNKMTQQYQTQFTTGVKFTAGARSEWHVIKPMSFSECVYNPCHKSHLKSTATFQNVR